MVVFCLYLNVLVWLLLLVVVIGLDQWFKVWVLLSLLEFQLVVVIDGFWNWYCIYNIGVVFSFLSDVGGWQKYFFIVLVIVISGLMVWWLCGIVCGNWKVVVLYVLIIGGVIGNVIDCQVYGYVVDFIQWYVGSYIWFLFNIVDLVIVVGVIGIVLFGLFDGKFVKKVDNVNLKL